MAFPPPSLKALSIELAELLIARKETLSLVETATGGLMGASILSVPGTSACFRGGVNAYSLPARSAFLDWSETDTQGYAGPTEAIVLKLAANLRAKLSTTWSLSESGVAGPTRPNVYRPEIKGPGYCPIAVVGPSGGFSKEIEIEQPKDRSENMVAFAEEGLKFLLDTIKATAKL